MIATFADPDPDPDRDADRSARATREMRHRLKNQLAVVSAVAKLLARHTADARELARKLEGKLITLAHAQDIMSMGHNGPIDARDAIDRLLSAGDADERVDVHEIPAAPLPDESVQQIALILDELVANALNHGALRDLKGRATLSGRSQDGILTLRWQEHSGGPVDPVEPNGGGIQLIRRLGSAGCAAPVIGWSPTGIVVEFHVRTVRNGSA